MGECSQKVVGTSFPGSIFESVPLGHRARLVETSGGRGASHDHVLSSGVLFECVVLCLACGAPPSLPNLCGIFSGVELVSVLTFLWLVCASRVPCWNASHKLSEEAATTEQGAMFLDVDCVLI